MSLRLKLIAIILFVTLVPLAVSTWTGLRIHQRAYDSQLLALQRRTAEQTALLAQQRLEDAIHSLSTLGGEVIHWSELSEDERGGAIWLVYRQSDDVALATLMDDQGAWLGSGAYRTAGSAGDEELAAHPLAPKSFLADLEVRFRTAMRNPGPRVRLGAPVPGDGAPLVPVLLLVDGAQQGKSWALAMALSLRTVCADVGRASAAGIEVVLLDDSKRSLCGKGGTLLVEAVPGLGEGADERPLTYRDASGNEMVAAASKLPLGWTVVARQPASLAYASSRRLRDQSALWIGISLVIAVAAGLFLSREITEPVSELSKAAEAVTKGDLGHRLEIRSGDELGRLASAFNVMSGEIGKRDAEIRQWNEELQARVEQRTRELQAAHELLLQAQKISAVSSLGAGIAHEMNSPLTAVLGFVQFLRQRASREKGREKEAKMLETIERESRRLHDIVKTLVGIAENYAGAGFVRRSVSELVENSLQPVSAALAEAKVEVTRTFEPNLEVLCDAAQLQEALGQILQNAKIAMGHTARGRLALSSNTAEKGQLVRIAVRDNGRGIPAGNLGKIFDPFFTTKDDWRGEGLGLTVAYRIVQAHHGTISVESKVGEGATFTITLPSAGARAHLV